MNRKYAPLQPAPTPSDGGGDAVASPFTSLNLGSNKRRRVGVSVACNNCRRRKIRCDGKRPACHACDERNESCVYEAKPTLGDESSGNTGDTSSSSGNTNSSNGGALVEAIQLLNAMPPLEVSHMLSTLKNVEDAPTIIACLRNGVTRLPVQTSTTAAMSAMLERPDVVVELETRHPFAYPVLAPIDVAAQEGPFRRLAEPSVGGSPHPQSPPEASSQHHTDQRQGEQPRSSPLHILPLERLSGLRIAQWTSVAVTDDFASRVISLYLETDHPLLSPFNSELFIHTLVTRQGSYCTPLLVNALMYWACQMYSTIDNEALSFVSAFLTEAERLWELERPNPSALTMAAAQFLSFGYLVQGGKKHAELAYLSEATRMGAQLGLFGVPPHVSSAKSDKMSSEKAKAVAYSAWGVFNWITLMGLFYHQPGVEYPSYPPTLPIPDDSGELVGEEEHGGQRAESTQFVDHTFPVLCQFWRIMHEVAVVYYRRGVTDISEFVPLHFAEYKFREILAWADRLPPSLARDEENPHHVVIFHLWLHAAILDIFRPFLRSGPNKRRLKTFPSESSTPDEVYAASVQQLKRLIIVYRLNYTSSAYTIIWHTALLYVANAVLRNKDDKDWLFYFLLCLYGYEGLRPSYRVAEPITRGLLSMAMRNGDISSDTARRVARDLRDKRQDPEASEIRATFMVDLDLAMSDPEAATGETLAGSFEDNAMMMDYTNVLQGN